MAFYILTRFVVAKYSCAFVERRLQRTSSLASRLTTVSLDITSLINYVYLYICSVLCYYMYATTKKVPLSRHANHAYILTQSFAAERPWLITSSDVLFLTTHTCTNIYAEQLQSFAKLNSSQHRVCNVELTMAKEAN